MNPSPLTGGGPRLSVLEPHGLPLRNAILDGPHENRIAGRTEAENQRYIDGGRAGGDQTQPIVPADQQLPRFALIVIDEFACDAAGGVDEPLSPRLAAPGNQADAPAGDFKFV